MTVETVTEPARAGTGATPFVRHIVRRRGPGAGVEDVTLCGLPWDRLNPRTGDLCDPCLAEYRRIRPGWPIPGR